MTMSDTRGVSLRALYDADLARVVRIAAPVFVFGMLVELSSHLFFAPHWSFVVPSLFALGMMLLVTWLSWGRTPARPQLLSVVIALPILLVIFQHVIAGAYITSAFFLVMAVLVCAGLIMPIVPMLITVVASWAMLVWVLFYHLPYPMEAVYPFPVLALVIAMLLHVTRKRAIVAGQRATELAEALAKSESDTRLRQRQHEFVQTIGAGLAHNLANQLQVIALAADDAAQRLAPTDASAPLYASARQAADKATSLVSKLQVYTGLGSREPVEMTTHDLCRALEARLPQGVQLRSASKARIVSDAELLVDAVLELVANAVAATSNQSAPEPEVRVELRDADGELHISVQDNGAGFSDADLTRATDPFYTTEPAGRPGLGLSFAKGVADMHNGDLRLHPRGERGSNVVIGLPLVG